MKKLIVVLAMTFLATTAFSQHWGRGFQLNLSFGNQGICHPGYNVNTPYYNPGWIYQNQPRGYWITVPLYEQRIIGYWYDVWGYKHSQYQWVIVGYTQKWISY